MPVGYFMHNGQLFKEGKTIISPDNRSFRYGDGLFETIRIVDQKIPLLQLHIDRLLHGMKLLQFEIPDHFTEQHFAEDITALCQKNRLQNAVVRLVVFRNDGGLFDADMRPHYIIQAIHIDKLATPISAPQGLTVDIFPDAVKSCDKFSEIKSNNFLPYLMAVIYARKNNFDDCLLLNQYGRVADSSIANIFIIKNEKIITPPLSEGGVSGVARRYLLQELPLHGLHILEQPVSPQELLEADEVFVTNAVRGVRGVGRFRHKEYTMQQSVFIQEIWKHKLFALPKKSAAEN